MTSTLRHVPSKSSTLEGDLAHRETCLAFQNKNCAPSLDGREKIGFRKPSLQGCLFNSLHRVKAVVPVSAVCSVFLLAALPTSKLSAGIKSERLLGAVPRKATRELECKLVTEDYISALKAAET